MAYATDAGELWWLFGEVRGSLTVSTRAVDVTTFHDTAGKSALLQRSAYTPFGEVRGGDGITGTDRGWLGQVSDEALTGLVYLNARYYDASLGRFLSPDPLTNPGDPRTLDAYRYSDNSLVMFTDASGLGPVYTGLSGTRLNNCNDYANYKTGKRNNRNWTPPPP